MPDRWKIDVRFLEQGNIYFFYKPRKGLDQVNGFQDISRFYVVLDPGNGHNIRFLILGPKRLPEVVDNGDRAWGFIEKVGGRGFAVKRPTSSIAHGARPAGEGLYSIILHGNHTHLAYILELPARLGPVQKDLNISRQGNYIMVIKHPDLPPPPGLDIGVEIQRSFPEELLNRFGLRRYIPANPPAYLDYEGTVVLLIGVNSDLSSLGIAVDKDKETEDTADIFNKLRVDKNRHPINPLIRGQWQ